MVQIDEALFSANSHKGSRHWAPAGQPLIMDGRTHQSDPVAVIGAISAESGVVHFSYKCAPKAAFTGDDVHAFLRELWQRLKHVGKVAVFCDQLRAHFVPQIMQDISGEVPRLPVRIVKNVAYRPDFNGIEGIWAIAKRDYRRRIDWFKANGRSWDQETVVKQCMAGITDETAKKAARAGWQKLEKGRPVKSARDERILNLDQDLQGPPERDVQEASPPSSGEDEDSDPDLTSFDLD